MAEHVGFSGTRHGMTDEQRATLRNLLRGVGFLHHGDCLGADAQAHEIALDLDMGIIIHPPVTDQLRAFCRGAIQTRQPFPYLQRDRHIVMRTARLLAAPQTVKHRRGGTWYTVAYAQRQRRPVVVIAPDGSTLVL